MDNSATKLTMEQPVPSPRPLPSQSGARRIPWRGFALAMSALVFCFAVPLWELVRFAAGSKLYSYILLIPFISFYLFWMQRRNLPAAFLPARKISAVFFLAGGATLVAGWLGLHSHPKLLEGDYLSLTTGSFLLLFLGICALFWGAEILRSLAFPLAFLFLMVPMPDRAVAHIDSFLQAGSAVAAAAFFKISGTPFFQDGLSFQVPGITLDIAPECSGIHSTLVLFVTSLLAARLLLQTTWKRVVLVLVVIPLALLRNGFRVFVLGELCVHISPRMIDSPIHHKGGPIFFVLSLIPFFLLLMALQRSERTLRANQPIENVHA